MASQTIGHPGDQPYAEEDLYIGSSNGYQQDSGNNTAQDRAIPVKSRSGDDYTTGARDAPRKNSAPQTPTEARSDRDGDPRSNGTGQDRARQRNRSAGGHSGKNSSRVCKKCGEHLTGQFVRALDGTFHLDCFKCRV